MTDLTISTEHGHILLRHDATPDPGSVRTLRLGVSGGVLDFAVDATDPVPSGELWDIDAAAWWLPLVFGDAVASTVLELADRVDDEHLDERSEGGIPADPNAVLLDTVRRLALALWLRRWRPIQARLGKPDFAPWLLDAEAASLAVDAEVALDPHVPIVAALLQPHLAHIAAGVREHHDRADIHGPDEIVDTVITNAAADVLEHINPNTTDWGLVADAVHARKRDEITLGEFFENLDAALAQSVDLPSRAVSTNASGNGNGADRPTRSGRATVDPRAVPAHVVSHEPLALAWDLYTADDAVRCEIHVPHATFGSLPRTDLYVRVRVDDEQVDEVLAVAPGAFVATLYVPATANNLPAAKVDVMLYGGGIPGSDALPMRSEAARTADVEAIADIVSHRAHVSSTKSIEDWDSPFAAELVTAVNLEPFSAEANLENATLDDVDLEWLLLSEATRGVLRGALSTSPSTSLSGRDPRLAIRATVTLLHGIWRIRLISLGYAGSLSVAIRLSSGDLSSHLVDIPEDGATLIVLSESVSEAPVALLLTPVDL